MLTESLRMLFSDSRARALCQEIQRGERQHSADTLPVSLLKVCEEISDLLPLRSHSKDWEGFAVTRVIQAHKRWIFVSGIGLPAGLVGEEPGILLTLDYIGMRVRPPLQQAMSQFNLTRRQVMVVVSNPHRFENFSRR